MLMRNLIDFPNYIKLIDEEYLNISDQQKKKLKTGFTVNYLLLHSVLN